MVRDLAVQNRSTGRTDAKGREIKFYQVVEKLPSGRTKVLRPRRNYPEGDLAAEDAAKLQAYTDLDQLPTPKLPIR